MKRARTMSECSTATAIDRRLEGLQALARSTGTTAAAMLQTIAGDENMMELLGLHRQEDIAAMLEALSEAEPAVPAANALPTDLLRPRGPHRSPSVDRRRVGPSKAPEPCVTAPVRPSCAPSSPSVLSTTASARPTPTVSARLSTPTSARPSPTTSIVDESPSSAMMEEVQCDAADDASSAAGRSNVNATSERLAYQRFTNKLKAKKAMSQYPQLVERFNDKGKRAELFRDFFESGESLDKMAVTHERRLIQSQTKARCETSWGASKSNAQPISIRTVRHPTPNPLPHRWAFGPRRTPPANEKRTATIGDAIMTPMVAGRHRCRGMERACGDSMVCGDPSVAATRRCGDPMVCNRPDIGLTLGCPSCMSGPRVPPHDDRGLAAQVPWRRGLCGACQRRLRGEETDDEGPARAARRVEAQVLDLG